MTVGTLGSVSLHSKSQWENGNVEGYQTKQESISYRFWSSAPELRDKEISLLVRPQCRISCNSFFHLKLNWFARFHCTSLQNAPFPEQCWASILLLGSKSNDAALQTGHNELETHQRRNFHTSSLTNKEWSGQEKHTVKMCDHQLLLLFTKASITGCCSYCGLYTTSLKSGGESTFVNMKNHLMFQNTLWIKPNVTERSFLKFIITTVKYCHVFIIQWVPYLPFNSELYGP